MASPEDTMVLDTTKGMVVIAMRPDLAPGHVDDGPGFKRGAEVGGAVRVQREPDGQPQRLGDFAGVA